MNKSNNLYSRKYGKHAASTNLYSSIRARLRAKFILDELLPEKSDRVLEIGCNDGRLVSQVSKHVLTCVGIDINKEVVDEAKNSNVVFMDPENLAFGNGAFTKIYSSHTFEHIPDIETALREVSRTLISGGIFIVIFPCELFRGQAAIKDSCVLYGHPFSARKLHLHRLTPAAIRTHARNTSLAIAKSKIVLAPYPDYLLVLHKR